MKTIETECAWCKQKINVITGEYNRAKKKGLNLYCNRQCAGLARRSNLSESQKKARKAEYDVQYRLRDVEALRRKKHEYFKRTYDPVKASEARQKKMPRHVEYCRRPEYRAYKKTYDRRHTAIKNYGEFADVQIALLDLNDEIRSRASKTEIYAQNNTLNKTQERKRKCKN